MAARQLWLGLVIGGFLGILGTTTVFMIGRERPAAARAGTVETPTKTIVAVDEPDRLPLSPVEAEAPTLVDIVDPRLSFRQLNHAAEEMALQNPAEAIREGMRIPGTDNREAFISSVFRTWAEKDGVSAATWAEANLSGEDLGDALYYVADGWAESDPQGAGEWFQKNTDGVMLDDAVWEILESWGRKDPQAAYGWSKALDPYVKQTAMEGLGEGWGAVDPVGARDAGLAMLANGENYAYDFLVSVAGQWGGSNPRAAADWGASLPNERLRQGILDEVTQTWALTDPEAAAVWAEGLTDPGTQRFAREGIAAGWSDHDPAGAVDWALGLTGDDGQRDEIVSDMVDSWAEVDPRGTVRWIEGRAPGPERDAVLRAFSGSIFSGNPEMSIRWANQIGDPAIRKAQVDDLTGRWIQAEGAAAIEALNRMNLSAGSTSTSGVP